MRPVLLGLLVSTALAGEAVTGYRGDRNGDYPGCTPPTAWDEASKKNLAWKTVMPNWCYGSPIVVGQKVFAMSEPGWRSDFPELVCLDLASGTILWQKPVDHLEQAVPDAARREKIRAAWASMLDRMRTAFNLCNESWETDPEDAAKVADIERRAKALGGELGDKYRKRSFGNRPNAGGYGVLRSWGASDKPGPDPKHGVTMREMKDAGLRLETFYGFGTAREGECFSTPASDGTAVYVVTDQGAHACFDLDGNLRWLTWFKPEFDTGGHDDSICRSPLLIDGLFITDLHMDKERAAAKGRPARPNPVIALEAATGKTVWQVPLPMEGGRDHGCGSSKVLDVGGTRVFITCGGHVLRVKDGKPLLTMALGQEDPCNGQTEIATDEGSDTVFYIPGKGQGSTKEVVAVTLRLSGDTLTEQERWRVPVKVVGHTLVVHQGRVYTGGDVIDIATGAVTSWGKDQRGINPTRWMIAVAGGHLYGLNTDGTARVFTLDGKEVAVNTVVNATSDPDLIARHLAITANAQMDFSYAAPFTFAGDRILMRSYDHLYCFAGR